jgi:hypothetical protein
VHHAPFDLYVALQIELVRRGGVVHPSDWNYRGRGLTPGPRQPRNHIPFIETKLKSKYPYIKLEDAAEKWRTPLTPPPVS